MNSARAKQLINEIQDLTEQYHAEVRSRRKPWPNSIRERVIELIETGMSRKEAAGVTKVPYDTINQWFFKKSQGQKDSFHTVTVTSKKPEPKLNLATVTVTSKKPEPKLNLATVTVQKPKNFVESSSAAAGKINVTTPTGYKLEGAPKDLIELLKWFCERGM